MRFKFLLPAILLPQLAFAQPGYFRIVGVAADDTLNVRSEPHAGSADVGDLPSDTGKIEVIGTDESGKWGQILWQEGNAWIAMRFLAPDPVVSVTGTALPAGLMCSGTEPFWTLTLSNDSAVYSNLDGAAYAMTLRGARVAEGRSDFPVQVGFGGAQASANVLVHPAGCSDGMSDRTFPWAADLLITGDGRSHYQVGCCHLPLEIGSH